MLLQANSGGGKSYALRKIIEDAFGKVQIILLDIEGEFATLREQYDFFLIGSTEHGADLPISLKIASVLPKRLLELQASTILDMSELKAHERILFVKRFLEALLNVPKDLWRPVVIVLDEAHVFCPQKERSESAAAVIDLASRGRKRGQCLWAATQRISKLNKDVAAECNNKLIGRAILDVDMKRAAEEIGFTTKEDVRSLRELGPGEFFAFGPALQRGVHKIRIDPVRTSHPKIGARILQDATPTPQHIKQLIGKLADLAQEAEHKEKTEADLKRDNAGLRGQLLAMENQVKKLQQQEPKEKVVEMIVEKEIVIERIPAGVFPAMQTLRDAMTELDAVIAAPAKEAFHRKAVAATRALDPVLEHQQPRGPPGKLRDGAMRMLAAVASFHPKPITKSQIGAFVGMSVSGGTFGTYLSELKRNEWITQHGDVYTITPAGMEAAGDITPVSKDPEEILRMWMGKFRAGAARMLQEIASAYPQGMTKNELGDRLGMVTSGGTFGTYLSELRRCGLIEVQGQSVRATKELFPEEA